MFNFFKKTTCYFCTKKISADQDTSELRIGHSDGTTEVLICGACADLMDKMHANSIEKNS